MTSPVVIRTSDLALFKRCRRLWGWLSHLKEARTLHENADYFWFGTGIHFALEDYHGYNKYGSPSRAFQAYVHATHVVGSAPPTWKEFEALGTMMMYYYAYQWLPNRDPLTTYYVDGVPQVEVNINIPLSENVFYGATLDRVIIDEYERLWIVEYKTTKQIRQYHLDLDNQCTAYCAIATRYYDRPIAGVIHQQHRKDVPKPPKILSTGKVSHDPKQLTTAAFYLKTLQDMYGSLQQSPAQNRKCYNELLRHETSDSDRFIARFSVERNEAQLKSFEIRLRQELEDILNPSLPLYPNPTYACEYCPLNVACVAMEDGSDWQSILDIYSTAGANDINSLRQQQRLQWENNLPPPEDLELNGQEQNPFYLSGVYSQNLQTLLNEPKDPQTTFLEELSWL